MFKGLHCSESFIVSDLRCVSTYSIVSSSYRSHRFRVDDVGIIMAHLRRVYSRRHQITIRELDLEINHWYLDTCMPQWQVFSCLTVGSHHWPLIKRSLGCSTSTHSFALRWDVPLIPWESSSSLVISLAFVNGSHHWPVIKWFLPCSTSTPCNHMARFVSFAIG